MKRSEQRTEDTWRMEDIYENEELYAKDCESLKSLIGEFASCRGTLKEEEESFLHVFEIYEKMNRTFEKVYVYANQRYHEDTANGKYQKMSGEAQILGAKLEEASSWLEPEILEFDSEVLTAMCGEGKKLAGYERFLSQIMRKKAHIADREKEELLARVGELGQAPSNIFSMLNNADIRFPEIEDGNGKKYTLTAGTYISYLESRDRVLRKNAFEALYSVYGQFINTLASAYYANAKQADFFAKERKYAGSFEAALDGGNIPQEVYLKLIRAVNDHMDAMHHYVSLRKKALGYDEIHMYDVHVPIVERPEKQYSFSEAKKIVKEAMAPLGPDYQALLQEGFDGRWIDVYENEGKRTGAYSWGAYGTHPYVLLNYHGRLNDVFTLAHEMGHALHSWHSDHEQEYLYAGYRIFVAEVASTCNEALLIRYLLDRTDDREEKKYLINYFLDQFKSTMYRQTMFAEFELETHRLVSQGEVLTADRLCEIYLGLNRKYFGEEMISDSKIAYEWARIPHFYTPFYVYQYATGFAAAIAISSRILSGEEGIVEKYRRFLSGGSSLDPIDLLKICGIDMTGPEPVEEALGVFEEYVREMERMMS